MTMDSGWRLLDFRGSGSWPEYWPPVEYRQEEERLIRFRLMPPPRAINPLGTLHGGFLASVAENSMGLFLLDESAGMPSAVMISLSLDYAAPGKAGVMLEGELELTRDGYRMQFLRMTLLQEGAPLVQASGILKKLKSA